MPLRLCLPLFVLLTGCIGEATTVPAESTDAPATADTEPADDTGMNATAEATPAAASGFYSLSTKSLAGDPVSLAEYDGQVALVVNVASECGLTPQYTALQGLHTDLSGRGFTVLAFPSNDFRGQEPGTPAEITEFCSVNYGVTFPLFEKVVTQAGDGQSPVYTRLSSMSGELPNWNFGKYVISRDGQRVRYFAPTTKPDDPALLAAIEEELGA